VVENSGYGGTWAAPIASLLMEKYLKDTIVAKRQLEVERISKADLIPAAIKHWYYVKDSIRHAKALKEIDENVKVEMPQPNRKTTFDPEAEPNRRDSEDTVNTRNPALLNPEDKKQKRDTTKP
jgi:penicillin-binding protein 2